jgi:vacuolar-type H+-ATPase subunit B/Vma2
MENELVGQGQRRRTIAETLETGWQLLESMPREDLRRIGGAAWSARQEAKR